MPKSKYWTKEHENVQPLLVMQATDPLAKAKANLEKIEKALHEAKVKANAATTPAVKARAAVRVQELKVHYSPTCTRPRDTFNANAITPQTGLRHAYMCRRSAKQPWKRSLKHI